MPKLRRQCLVGDNQSICDGTTPQVSQGRPSAHTHGSPSNAVKAKASPCTHSRRTNDLTGTQLHGKSKAVAAPSLLPTVNQYPPACLQRKQHRLGSRIHRCMNYDDHLLRAQNQILSSRPAKHKRIR